MARTRRGSLEQERDDRDVVVVRAGLEHHPEQVRAEGVGIRRAITARASESLEADRDRLGAPFDEPVGVEDDDGAALKRDLVTVERRCRPQGRVGAAVEEGRGIYDNIAKTLAYLLGGNVGELTLMCVAALVGWPLPLLRWCPIRWASNLYADSRMVTAARTHAGEKLIVALPLNTPGVVVGDHFDLLALGSTASSYLNLQTAYVPAEQVLSRDFDGFLRSVRPTFLVLQSAICLGLTRTALAQSRSTRNPTA